MNKFWYADIHALTNAVSVQSQEIMDSARINARSLTSADINANSIAHRIVHHALNHAKLSVATLNAHKCVKSSACCAVKNVKMNARIPSAQKSVMSLAIGSLVICNAKKS